MFSHTTLAFSGALLVHPTAAPLPFQLHTARFVRHWARKRTDKPRRLPNRPLRHEEYTLHASAGGGYNLMQPYPPQINRSILNPDHEWDRRLLNRKFNLRWKNVEYSYVPRLLPSPRLSKLHVWGGEVVRIDHSKKKSSGGGRSWRQ
eukprot:GDKI01034785.1.p1 GENE.GDKI01034785.1~~GDKI01034785.1.p1  ORF type:complete len:147 (-),score=17.68 GDKI01034785.1:147-587(-)